MADSRRHETLGFVLKCSDPRAGAPGNTWARQRTTNGYIEVKWQCCVCVSVVYERVFALHCAVHCCARHAFISFHFISFHFIHTPPWVKSQGSYVRACATCLCHARVCTGVLRAQCVYCGVCGPFSARGVKARPSPLPEASRKLHPNPKGRHDPTARDPIHQHTPASLPPTLRGGGLLRIPGLHRSAQSV